MDNITKKQEFLNTALDLFYEKGYDKTTVNDILGKVKASKGAFYHYFKSKEDVLEEVARRHIQEEITITQKIAEDNQMNAGEKINKIFNDVMMHKALNIRKRQKISRVLEDEGNIKFQRKIIEHKMKMLHLPYRTIVEQGVKEGVFDTIYPEEVAEQIIQMLIILSSVVTRLALGMEENPNHNEIIKRKVKAYQEAVERILGAPKGLMNFEEIIRIFDRCL